MVKHLSGTTLHDQRKNAQREAAALIKLYGGLNKAAHAIGMNKGRLSFIVRGVWTQVAVNEIDIVMLTTGRAIRQNDLAFTSEARELAQQFQAQLSDLHGTAAQLLKVLRRL